MSLCNKIAITQYQFKCNFSQFLVTQRKRVFSVVVDVFEIVDTVVTFTGGDEMSLTSIPTTKRNLISLKQ